MATIKYGGQRTATEESCDAIPEQSCTSDSPPRTTIDRLKEDIACNAQAIARTQALIDVLEKHPNATKAIEKVGWLSVR